MATVYHWTVVLAIVFITLATIGWIYYCWKYNKFAIPESVTGSNNEIWVDCSFFPRKYLLLFRFMMILFALAANIAMEISYPLNITYFTLWAFLIFNVFFILVSVISVYIEYPHYIPSCMQIRDMDNSVHFSRLKFVCWILYQIELSQALFVFIVVWTVLYPFSSLSATKRDAIFLSWTSICSHVLNVVFIYFDFFCNQIPVSFYVGITINALLIIIYVFVEFIWYEIVHWNHYFFMVTSNPSNSILLIFLFVIQLVFWCIAYGCYRLKIKHILKEFITDGSAGKVVTVNAGEQQMTAVLNP